MIETITGIFVVAGALTLWGWILAVIASIIFIASIENDHYATPSITAIVLGIIFWPFLAAVGVKTLIFIVAGYALAGVGWSLFKWHRYVNKVANKYREKCGTTLSKEQKSDLKREVSVSENKSRLTGWIAWWPWSLLWSLTGDFFNMLYDAMVNAYQKISNSALSKFDDEKPKRDVITDADTNRYRR